MKTIFFLNLKSSLKDMYLLFWSIFMPCTAIIALKIFFTQPSRQLYTGMIAVSVFFLHIYDDFIYRFITKKKRRVSFIACNTASPMEIYCQRLKLMGINCHYPILYHSFIFYSGSSTYNYP